MNTSIFRQEALERLGSPEQLDQLMPVTRTRGWVALGGAGLLLVLGLLWGAFGTVETRAEVEGVLFRPGGVQVVESPDAGRVTGIAVEIGAEVREGQALLRVAPAGAGRSGAATVVSPGPARVLDLGVFEGEAVEKGTPLLTLEMPDSPLQAILYVPVGQGQAIRPGMDVEVPLPAEPTAVAARWTGRVKHVARLPATRDAMIRTLRSEDLVNALLRAGPCLAVAAEPAPPPGSGTAVDAMRNLSSGTPCRGWIIVGRQRPVSLVFPAVRHLLGS